MAVIIPFKGLRYNQQKINSLTTLVTPPYDIIDETAQARYYAENPANIIRLELGMIFPQDSASNNRYTRSSQYLEKWIADEILQYEEKPAIYLYQQEFSIQGQKMIRTGMVCGLKVEEYDQGNILPHKETLSKPKADRLQLMRATRCNFSSIFGLYSDPDKFIGSTLLGQIGNRLPDISLIDEVNEIHKIWTITDNSVIDQVVKYMADKNVYIADGHHRYETALEYAKEMKEQGYSGYDYVMITLVNLFDEGLVVLPTHRLLGNIPHLNLGVLKQQLAELFEVEQLENYFDLTYFTNELKERGKGKHVLGMYTNDSKAYILTLKNNNQAFALLPPEKSSAWKNLDVAILDNLILDQMLGIGEIERRSQNNLAYSHSPEWVVEQINNKNYQLGFIINSTRAEQVIDVAQAHDKMPPKSTYFYPQLITGLIINHLGV
ncbi:MAG: DUF1015 domain-containing protein [Syntrophomonas sp.]